MPKLMKSNFSNYVYFAQIKAVYSCVCAFAHYLLRVCMCVNIGTCIFEVYVCVFVSVCVYRCVCVCVCVCVSVCVCACVCQ